MLKLLLGGSGSGKTTLLYQRIRARAEVGEKSILLVPEQFTSSTEGRIHREMGDALSGLVESFSFTSLAEHILSAEGGSAVQTFSDAGRAVLVRRALEELQDNVHYYYRHRRSAAFCQMAAETIDELKSAGLSGQQLYELAQDCGTDSAKLSELALIFQGYETLLAGTGMDPSDRLELAASRRGRTGPGRTAGVPAGQGRLYRRVRHLQRPEKAADGRSADLAAHRDGGPLRRRHPSRAGGHEPFLRREAGGGAAAPAGPPERH